MASYAGNNIKKTIEMLNKYKTTLNEKSEIPRVKFRLDTDLNSLSKSVEELLNVLDDSRSNIDARIYNNFKKDIQRCFRLLESVNTFEDAIEIIDNLLYYNDYTFDKITSFEFDGTKINVKSNNLELDNDTVNNIMRAINVNRDFNLFSSRALKGYTMENFKATNDKIHLYALEEEEENLSRLKTVCDRTIKGVSAGSRISHEVFDMVWLSPIISWECAYTALGGLAEKTERVMLRNDIKHLKTDGIFIYHIPHYRLTRDIAYLISKLLNNVQIVKSGTPNYVIVTGTKDITRDVKQDIYDYLNSFVFDDLDYTLNIKYNLPKGGLLAPEFFRGSALSENDIDNLIKTSGLMDSFWNKNAVSDRENSARPLMPFNMGQIGLVLTSGCLDGIVEEYEGQYHAIKGMVTKLKEENSNNDVVGQEAVTEIISNKVQINIVTPDGEFIELA